MSVQNTFLKKYPSDSWRVLNRIQKSLGLPDSKMADFTCMTLSQFRRSRQQKKDISIRGGMTLADILNISFESLVIGELDYNALIAQYLGDNACMPEKYLTGANSKRRTVVNILNYIEKVFGWEERHRALQKFQMTEQMFLDADAPINLRYSVDLCNSFLKEYGDPDLLVEMGRNSVVTNRNSEMGLLLSKTRNLHELFELMFGEVLEKYVEKNIQWNLIHLRNNRCVLEGVPNPDVVSLLGKESVFARSVSFVREGFVSSIPEYLGYESAPIVRTACVSQGDSITRFELNFEPIIKKRKRMLSSVAML